MRIRSIRPEFYDSESMGNVSWDARFVFECLWSYVQDNGVNRDNARMIRGTCMPYDSDEVIPRIEAALDELEAVGCVVRYTWRGKRLLWLPGFLTYQKIDRPSTCLFPTPQQVEEGEGSTVTRDTLDGHSRDTRETLATGVGVGVSSEDILSRGGGGSKNILTRACAREAASTPTGEDEDEDELMDSWRPSVENVELAKRLDVDVAVLERRFRDKAARKGLVALGVKRRTVAALDATFRSWIEHEAQWAGERPKPVTQPDRPNAAPPRFSWCSPDVRALMVPYRDRFPPDTSLGPGKDWYEACKTVADRLNAGEPIEAIEAGLTAQYGTPTTRKHKNNPRIDEQEPT